MTAVRTSAAPARRVDDQGRPRTGRQGQSRATAQPRRSVPAESRATSRSRGPAASRARRPAQTTRSTASTTSAASARQTAGGSARKAPARPSSARPTRATSRSAQPRVAAQKARAAQPRRAQTSVSAPRVAAPRVAAQKAQPRTKVTVHQRRFISLRGFVALSAITFFSVLLLAVMIQSLRIEGQNHIDRTTEQIAAENVRTLDLRAAIAERESPERIMAKARELGMIDPGPVAPLISETDSADQARNNGTDSTDDTNSQDSTNSQNSTNSVSQGSTTAAVESQR